MRRRNKKSHIEWSKRVRERDGCCQVCLKSSKDYVLHAHHIIPSNFKEYQTDDLNGITLCAGCHTMGKFSAHKHPLWFANWMRTNKTTEYYLAMERINEIEVQNRA